MSNRAKVVPMRFAETNAREREEYKEQLEILRDIYGDSAEFLETREAGEEIPECDAIAFPQLIGAAYHYKDVLRKYNKPMIIITSRFGTVDMWDWELIAYRRTSSSASTGGRRNARSRSSASSARSSSTGAGRP